MLAARFRERTSGGRGGRGRWRCGVRGGHTYRVTHACTNLDCTVVCTEYAVCVSNETHLHLPISQSSALPQSVLRKDAQISRTSQFGLCTLLPPGGRGAHAGHGRAGGVRLVRCAWSRPVGVRCAARAVAVGSAVCGLRSECKLRCLPGPHTLQAQRMDSSSRLATHAPCTPHTRRVGNVGLWTLEQDSRLSCSVYCTQGTPWHPSRPTPPRSPGRAPTPHIPPWCRSSTR
jgi:hypothetical protein